MDSDKLLRAALEEMGGRHWTGYGYDRYYFRKLHLLEFFPEVISEANHVYYEMIAFEPNLPNGWRIKNHIYYPTKEAEELYDWLQKILENSKIEVLKKELCRLSAKELEHIEEQAVIRYFYDEVIDY